MKSGLSLFSKTLHKRLINYYLAIQNINRGLFKKATELFYNANF